MLYIYHPRRRTNPTVGRDQIGMRSMPFMRKTLGLMRALLTRHVRLL
jgi:hypothetical protein